MPCNKIWRVLSSSRSHNKWGFIVIHLVALVFLSFAQAQTLPNCLDRSGNSLPVNDAQVLQMKISTPNQFLARAHIKGFIQHAYADHNGHTHFEARIGAKPTDTIEIVYNESFGSLPPLVPNMIVEACGDYITSNAATSQYPASPDGAILHWVHRTTGGHPGGYVAISGVAYGQGSGNGGADNL